MTRIIKPQKLGILTRCFEFNRRAYFAVSALLYIPLGNRDGLYSEAGMWKFAASELGKDAVLDAGIPKAKPEFLVAGSAYVPGGGAKPGCSVRVRLGGLEKTLHVYGERFWRGSFPSDPVPFTSMPVDWSRAYGGKGFEPNPLGKGFAPVVVNDVAVHWLPNILYPSERIVSPEKRCEPASFGSLDFSWPQRFSKAGTHDDRWLKEEFPGFARDIDWTIFNTASPDQWFEKQLSGDESYLFQNMHPEHPVMEGALPGFTARCFIARSGGEGETFEEVPTRLSTVWFFPHAEKAILIFQGLCEVADEEASEVTQVIAGAERLGEQKAPEHYREVARLRLDREKGPLYALRDADLLPRGIESVDASVADDKTLMDGEDLIRTNMRKKAVREIERARAVVAGYGLDPDLHGPKLPPPEEPPPDLDHLAEYLERMEAEVEERKREAEEGKARSLQAVENQFVALGLDFDLIRKEIAETPKGPPTFSAQAQIDALKGIADRLNRQGIDVGEIEGYLADEGFRSRLFEGEQKLREAYRFSAHHQDPAAAMGQDRSSSVRRAVQEAHGQGAGFAGADLTGADLSGLDLSGVDFTGAFLESVDFSGCNLEGCTFSNAVIAHACLAGARLGRARFDGANLGAARLADADAAGADLTGAVMARADLTGACFRGADLQGADLTGAVFGNTDFSEVRASMLTFFENDLKGLTCRGARMERCNFLRVDMGGVDFSGARLVSAVFLGARGQGACFQGADMTNVRLVEQCDFSSADFTGAVMDKANLRGSRLDGCDLTRVRMDGADLTGCSLHKAKLYQAIARESRFTKADLRGAVMTSINAMNASFQRADIRGADLRGANLFQADLARVHADQGTQLADALSTKVRIYPRRAS